MTLTEAVVAVIVAILAGGGLGALWTSRATARRIGAEGERTTVETFSTEWRSIITRLEDNLVEMDRRHKDCLSTLEAAQEMFHKTNVAMMAVVAELRGEVQSTRLAAAALKERVATIEDEQPVKQRQAVQEVVRQLGGLDPEQHGHPTEVVIASPHDQPVPVTPIQPEEPAG